MAPKHTNAWRRVFVWVGLLAVIGGPLIASAYSPLLAWRDPIYILAGFAGIFAMGLLFVQPLVIGGYVPGMRGPRARLVHRTVGALLLVAVLIHVGALWITSPPDVIDALLLASPTPFSIWGVLAMWAIFATATLAVVRKRIGLRAWRILHMLLVVVIAGGTIAHAMLIDGTMEQFSKIALSVLVALACAKGVMDVRARLR